MARNAPMIRLKHPDFAGLIFGPDRDEAIVFGNRAGQPEFEAWVPEDHPLLADLMAAHPEIEVLRPDQIAQVYLCPFHPDAQFRTKASILAHMGAESHFDDVEDVAAPPVAPRGQYERELERPDHVPGQYVDDPTVASAQPISAEAYAASVQAVPNVTVANQGPVLTPAPDPLTVRKPTVTRRTSSRRRATKAR